MRVSRLFCTTKLTRFNQPDPLPKLNDLDEALKESNIPIIIEARDWTRLPESFHREIERNYIVLKPAIQ